ncbi:hypothetical protein [Geoalkalibacter halelectricus]|uniref:hypothetical protein n=1 Tax=Geoalkalibacter halelectricus TaxID=2847045 RepID=UPI003D1E945F
MTLFLASFLAIYTGMHALVFWGMHPLLFGHRALPTPTGVVDGTHGPGAGGSTHF